MQTEQVQYSVELNSLRLNTIAALKESKITNKM